PRDALVAALARVARLLQARDELLALREVVVEVGRASLEGGVHGVDAALSALDVHADAAARDRVAELPRAPGDVGGGAVVELALGPPVHAAGLPGGAQGVADGGAQRDH